MKRFICALIVAVGGASPAAAGVYYSPLLSRQATMWIDPDDLAATSAGERTAVVYSVFPDQVVRIDHVEFDCAGRRYRMSSSALADVALSPVRALDVRGDWSTPVAAARGDRLLQLVCEWPKTPSFVVRMKAQSLSKLIGSTANSLRPRP